MIPVLWINIKEFIQVGNLMNVMYVRRAFVIRVLWLNIKEFIQVRNLMNVIYVRKAFCDSGPLDKHQRVHTGG